MAFKYWEEDVLDKLAVGVNNAGDLIFPYKINGQVMGYKVHKKEIKPKGVVKNHMYPNQLIGSYDHDKPLYIVEGEKDVSNYESYNSHNTEQCDVERIKILLNRLPLIKEKIKKLNQ